MKLIDKKIWITADWHFGHNNIIKYCNRPFANTTEMNNTIIKNYNKVVGKNDLVYVLGDVSFLNTVSTAEIIKSLNGFKILIKGNHDHKTNSGYRKMGFNEVYDKPIILNNLFILSHEPISPLMLGGFLNIHGHTHNTSENNVHNQFSACLEMTDYKPISLADIRCHLEKLKCLK